MRRRRMNFPKGYRVIFSDDGELLVCLARNVVVIDAAKRQRTSTSHPLSHPSSACFSPDGRLLAVKNTSGRIVVVDPLSGELLHDFKNQRDGEGCEVHFSVGGDVLIDGSWDGEFTIRAANSGTVRNQERFPGEMITGISHDRSRRRWLVEHSTRHLNEEAKLPNYVSIRKWPFTDATTHLLPLGQFARSATLSPDGKFFCYLTDLPDLTLHVARSSDGKIFASDGPIEYGGTTFDLAWSANGRYIASIQARHFVFYRAADLSIVGRVPCQYPSSVSFHPSAPMIALGSWETSALVRLDDVLAGGVVL